MKITFGKIALPGKGALVLLCRPDAALSATGQAVDDATGGAVSRAIADSAFKGERGSFLEIIAPAGLDCGRLILAGSGSLDELGEATAADIGGAIVARLAKGSVSRATIVLDALPGLTFDGGTLAARIAFGALLRSYRFDRYLGDGKKKKDRPPKRLAIRSAANGNARKSFAPLESLARGIFLTRDLVSEPGNVLYPESFAARCRELGELGLEVEVLAEAALQKLGMGALLAVGQGSARESRVVVMRWQGASKKARAAPLALIGKGVTFDSGGISLKPGAGMGEMKWDMGGAGTVVGVMAALARRKARANVVGVIGLVENMPSGKAQRPGDIVTAMSGETIEVLNTDAEGRLVLADILYYARQRFKPSAMIDLATLTGAIIIALGHENAGLLSNNDDLAATLLEAAGREGEGLWRLPLGKAYDKLIDSNIADMQNIGQGRDAGSITAAQFLQRFVGDVPWAHLDIAGMAWSKKDAPVTPKGATAYGVRLLDRLVADYYES